MGFESAPTPSAPDLEEPDQPRRRVEVVPRRRSGGPAVQRRLVFGARDEPRARTADDVTATVLASLAGRPGAGVTATGGRIRRSTTPVRPADGSELDGVRAGRIRRFPRPARAAAEPDVPRHVQAKLVVGAVNDPSEREADRIADVVSRLVDDAARR